MCLPAAIAAPAWRMPAAGLPVASTMTSIAPCIAFTASVVKVVVAILSASQPTVRQASRARWGSRSTITGTSSPGVCGTCDRNIEPNLPAPISATRTGFPAAWRAWSRWWRFMEDRSVSYRHSGTRVFAWTRKPEVTCARFRFALTRPGMMVLPRRLAMAPCEPQQRVVVHGLDRREIAVRDVFRPGGGANIIRDRVQRQIDDLARIRRDVPGRAVHQIAVEHQHAAGLAGGRDNTAVFHQPRHGFLVQRPQRIGRGRKVVRGLEVAGGLAFRHQHQRAVDRHHLVEEDRDVHGARLRHAVVALPGAVVLVPLPDVAGEGRFGVDLVLVHVDLLAEQLLDRIDHARVRAEQAERLVIEMGGESGARRAALLAPYLRPLGAVDRLCLLRQQVDLLTAEQLGEKQPALAVEVVDLLLGQLHRFLLAFSGQRPYFHCMEISTGAGVYNRRPERNEGEHR